MVGTRVAVRIRQPNNSLKYNKSSIDPKNVAFPASTKICTLTKLVWTVQIVEDTLHYFAWYDAMAWDAKKFTSSCLKFHDKTNQILFHVSIALCIQIANPSNTNIKHSTYIEKSERVNFLGAVILKAITFGRLSYFFFFPDFAEVGFASCGVASSGLGVCHFTGFRRNMGHGGRVIRHPRAQPPPKINMV